MIPRSKAESLYKETMYDTFKVPDAVQELRLVNLERWNLNSQINPVLKSTGLLGKMQLTKFKHNANKKQLEVNFEVHPAGAAVFAEVQDLKGSFPSLGEAVPDGQEDDDADGAPKGADGGQEVTPWSVEAGDEGIDYDKLIRDF